ncbi:DUF4097 domain-containing protein [Bdellovibrionota bacterium]
MRKYLKILTFCLLVLFSQKVWSIPAPHDVRFPPRFAFPFDGTISISVNHGLVTIVGTSGQDVVIEELTVRDPDQISLTQQRGLMRYELRAVPKTGREEFWEYTKHVADRYDVRIRLRVPKTTSIQISNLYGTTSVFGMEGSLVDLDQMNGVINVENSAAPLQIHGVSSRVKGRFLSGPLNIKSESGEINLEGVSDGGMLKTSTGNINISDGIGTFELVTKSGKLTINGIDGALHAKSDSGFIFADKVRGFVDVSSQSGGVEVILDKEQIPVPLKFSSLTGDLKLHIPKSLPATLTAQTTAGSIYSGVSIRSRDDRNLSGRLNGGGELISLNTENGDISLLAR